jgi:hypothetical protein
VTLAQHHQQVGQIEHRVSALDMKTVGRGMQSGWRVFMTRPLGYTFTLYSDLETWDWLPLRCAHYSAGEMGWQ